LAESLSDSAYTSIKRRCEQAEQAKQPNHKSQQAIGLLPFVGNPQAHMPNGLPLRLTDYLALVDWTGCMLRNDKRGSIPEDVPPILVQLNIGPTHRCYLSQHFESEFKSLVGTDYHVKLVYKQFGQR
jgi:hypothetical protein